eukprot:Skav215976  [mRNA]  locus=scaffold1856:11743:18721:+ [translate_table: standard]
MSISAPQRILILEERIRFLEREVRRLGQGRAAAEVPASDWELVEEEGFSEQIPFDPRQRFELEEGPPELPVICRSLAEKNLRSAKHSPIDRATAAFRTGYWVRIALETETPFSDDHSLKGLAPAFWVAFRGAVGGLPIRTTKKADCLRACWEDSARIILPFASLTELHIACAGAGRTECLDEEVRGATLSYPKWCARLISCAIRSRCAFSVFLSFAIVTSRSKPDRLLPAPTFFPIPITSWDLFNGMPAASRSKPSASLLDKVVFVMVAALNFWHSGGVFVEREKLQRGLNPQHVRLVKHLKALVKSDDPSISFDVCKAGRRFPELTARLAELTEYATKKGLGADPYTKTFPGVEEGPTVDNSVMPELEPYRDLDPSRLLLTGRAHWDITEFLSDNMVMVYRDPRVLEFGASPSDYPRIRDSVETVRELADVWDKNGLLVAHFDSRGIERPAELVRVFNTYKGPLHDRQIGDRRGRNSVEQKVLGPSRWLPAAPDLQDLMVDPQTQKVYMSVSDRKDYYHQIWVTKARALSNTVGPGIPTEWLEGTSVWPELLRMQKKQKYVRAVHGDLLGKEPRKKTAALARDTCWIAFGSIFQGDHAGVDLATEGHVQLLKDHGLLEDGARIQSQAPLRSSTEAQGLCIDDYFSISVEDCGVEKERSGSAKNLKKAQGAYDDVGLLGSPEKDVKAESEAKVIGGYINSSDRARKVGLVTLGPTLQRKLALSYITLMLCNLGFTTDSLHLCIMGAWVSMMMFRRPMMSLLDASFRFVNFEDVDSSKPRVLKMSRKVKNELTMVAVLMPLLVTELSAPYHTDLFATDASLKRGAVVRSHSEKDRVEVLWKSCRSKGSYTRFRTRHELLSQALGVSEDFEEACHEKEVSRPLAFRFDFIEVFSGASEVTKFVSELGFSVGPCIDLSESAEYNLEYIHVTSWLCHLCSEGYLCGFMLEPPCTTFSIMRRPQLRSLEEPFGFDPHDPQTALGTLLAQRAFQMMRTGMINEVPGILETTYSSRLRALPSFEALRKEPSADMCRTDSCRFGSIHMKPFRFLSVHVSLRGLARRCQCKSKHVKVEGKYTKASATYTTELSWELARSIGRSMQARKRLLAVEECPLAAGLENLFVNEVVQTEEWDTLFSWKFRRQAHVNILELSSVLRLAVFLAKEASHKRVVALTDSSVVRGAISKGRTSSRGLGAVLRKICAVLVAAGVYITVPYVPTRLNVADDPTREVELRQMLQEKIQLTKDEMFDMACSKGFRRWAANWARMMVLILGPKVLRFKDRTLYRKAQRGESRIVAEERSFSLKFDKTLGYPGEGPGEFVNTKEGRFAKSRIFHSSSPGWIFTWLSTDSLLGLLLFPFCLVLALLSLPFVCLVHHSPRGTCRILVRIVCLTHAMGACAMPVFPRNAGDKARAAVRSTKEPPTVSRPVLPVTSALRERYFQVFCEWLQENDIDFDFMLSRHIECIEEINLVLVNFGKALFHAGRPYNHYLETINLVVAKKPLIRRMLQTAWDYAFSWVKSEPSAHHVAMPFQVLLACISVAVAWGWDKVAGALALMWGGLLRAGEFLAATRAQLILPRDVDYTVTFALLSIQEPKTRLTAARHQVSKLDIPDLLRVVDVAFGKLNPGCKLWQMSGQTLRTRFRQILQALSLPVVRTLDLKPLDLGSLRSGGATWLITVTEQSDLVLRRGRWLNLKTMSIYLQESMAVLYLQRVPTAAKERVLYYASLFPSYLEKACLFNSASISPSQWNALLKLES